MPNSPSRPKTLASRPRKKLVSPKDAAIIGAIAKGESPEKAVAAAGMTMTKQNAEVVVEHVMKQHGSTNGAMVQALTEVGVDLTTVAKTLKEGLEATAVAKRGLVFEDVPDYSVRHRYMESALDIMGGRAPTKQIVESVKSHEETVAIVEGLRANPEMIALIKQRIEQRAVKQITTETVHE